MKKLILFLSLLTSPVFAAEMKHVEAYPEGWHFLYMSGNDPITFNVAICTKDLKKDCAPDKEKAVKMADEKAKDSEKNLPKRKPIAKKPVVSKPSEDIPLTIPPLSPVETDND